MNKNVAAACAIVVAGVAGTYVLYGGTGRRNPTSTAAAAGGPATASSDALASEVARLRRYQETGASPTRGRDLFRFAPVPRAISVPVPVLPGPAAAPAPRSRPALRLIGVAEDGASGSPVRTAIISGPDRLYVVKEGERVTSQYNVTRISADVVELVDADDASALRLVLK